MKKTLLIFQIVIISFSFLSCDKKANKDILISEFHCFQDTKNRVVELYNTSEHDVSLSSFTLVIDLIDYNDYIIPLFGIIPKKGTYIIAKDTCDINILEKADLISSDLFFNGTQALVLKNSGIQVDIVGTLGFHYDYGSNLDMCRKKEFMIPRQNYEPYDWIRYAPGSIEHLGKVDDVISDSLLNEGPRLTREDFELPFAIDDNVGGGGAIEASLRSLGDGDTTSFSFDLGSGFYGGSVRYLCIDTPEIQHGTSINEQPWGEAAKKYNNDLLKGAKRFVVQTSQDSGIYETYGRFLAFVWISFIDNPKPSDYVMVNFLMIKEGYSTLRYIGGNQIKDSSRYLGISYSNFMRNAEIPVEKNHVKVHGEVDPNFDYR